MRIHILISILIINCPSNRFNYYINIFFFSNKWNLNWIQMKESKGIQTINSKMNIIYYVKVYLEWWPFGSLILGFLVKTLWTVVLWILTTGTWVGLTTPLKTPLKTPFDMVPEMLQWYSTIKRATRSKIDSFISVFIVEMQLRNYDFEIGAWTTE